MSGLGSRQLAALGMLALSAAAPCAGTINATASVAPAAHVRVAQLGYPLDQPKRAYLLAPAAENGATFTVRGNGHVWLTAPIGADQGAWSASYPHVYALDFDSFNNPGAYEIQVAGPVPAHSLTFRIDTGSHLFAQAVLNARSYYQNSRDGRNFIPSGLRTAPGHLNDEHAMTYLPPVTDSNDNLVRDPTSLGVRIDASGAWWDAGDYLKFVETTSYTVAMMLVGVRDFPRQLGHGAPGDMTAESAFGVDWLSRMWRDDSLTLYYQVGIASGNSVRAGDHDIWRLPQTDDTFGSGDAAGVFIRNRPVFREGSPGSPISPNLAGRLAAAFALCAQVYATTRPALAGRCLSSGRHVFALADAHPTGNLFTVSPFDFYPEVEWRDDLELGATELALAIQQRHGDASFYLRQAAHWAHAYITGPNDATDTLNLYDVSAQAHYDLYHAIAAAHDPAGLEVNRADLLADVARQLALGESTAATDPFGFGFPWAAFDTTSHGAGLSVTAAEYDALTGGTRYQADQVRWLGNILGANAWGTSLIVGDGSVFPFCMQHQVTNLAGSLDGSPPVLAGAAVEGPNSFAATGTVSGMKKCPPLGGNPFKGFDGGGAVYRDDVQSWSTVEPALYLTITSPLAFRWLM